MPFPFLSFFCLKGKIELRLHNAFCNTKGDLNRITQQLITLCVRLAPVKSATDIQPALSFYACRMGGKRTNLHMAVQFKVMKETRFPFPETSQRCILRQAKMFMQMLIKMQLLHHSPEKQHMAQNQLLTQRLFKMHLKN